MKPRYSGKKSGRFWDRINAVPGNIGKDLYSLGCDLQDLEHVLLQLLREAEDGHADKKALRKKLSEARKMKRR
jgi:hypothetical protein